jgi:hypothetical protein
MAVNGSRGGTSGNVSYSLLGLTEEEITNEVRFHYCYGCRDRYAPLLRMKLAFALAQLLLASPLGGSPRL